MTLPPLPVGPAAGPRDPAPARPVGDDNAARPGGSQEPTVPAAGGGAVAVAAAVRGGPGGRRQSAPPPKPASPAVQPASRPSAPQQAAAAAQAPPPRDAAAPEVSDAQPTIPIRALGDTVPDPTATAAAARLVVLTTDLRGWSSSSIARRWSSVAPTRTTSCCRHRSISRHHAKVVRDGEHHTIVDLQSANGVRVNGEDYERIELNPGDVDRAGARQAALRRRARGLRVQAGRRVARSGQVEAAAPSASAWCGLATIALVLYRKATRSSSESAAPPPIAATAPGAAPPHFTAAPDGAPTAPQPAPRRRRPAAILAEARQAAGAEDWEKSQARRSTGWAHGR